MTQPIEPVFKPGDLVRIKQAQRILEVEHVDRHLVYCFWYRDGERKANAFYASTLEPVPTVDA